MGNLIGAGDTPNQQQKKLMADLSASKPMVCPDCGYDVFLEGSKFRIISKLLVGASHDQLIPIPVFLCGNCGAVNQDLLPSQLK